MRVCASLYGYRLRGLSPPLVSRLCWLALVYTAVQRRCPFVRAVICLSAHCGANVRFWKPTTCHGLSIHGTLRGMRPPSLDDARDWHLTARHPQCHPTRPMERVRRPDATPTAAPPCPNATRTLPNRCPAIVHMLPGRPISAEGDRFDGVDRRAVLSVS